MAEVTFNTPAPTRHVWGDLVVRFFNVSGVSGSTLHTNLQVILFADPQALTAAGTASLITSWVLDPVTGLITITSSGPMVNEIIMVIARKG